MSSTHQNAVFIYICLNLCLTQEKHQNVKFGLVTNEDKGITKRFSNDHKFLSVTFKKTTKNSSSLKIQFTHTLKRSVFSPCHFDFRDIIKTSPNWLIL